MSTLPVSRRFYRPQVLHSNQARSLRSSLSSIPPLSHLSSQLSSLPGSPAQLRPSVPVDSRCLRPHINRRGSRNLDPLCSLLDTRHVNRLQFQIVGLHISLSCCRLSSPATDPARPAVVLQNYHQHALLAQLHPQHQVPNPARVRPSVQVINPLISQLVDLPDSPPSSLSSLIRPVSQQTIPAMCPLISPFDILPTSR